MFLMWRIYSPLPSPLGTLALNQKSGMLVSSGSYSVYSISANLDSSRVALQAVAAEFSLRYKNSMPLFWLHSFECFVLIVILNPQDLVSLGSVMRLQSADSQPIFLQAFPM